MVRPVIRVPYAEDTPGQVEPSSFSNRSANQRHLMSKIPSLVFDMEDTEEHNTQSCRGGLSVHDQPAITDVVQKLQSLLEPWSEAEYMVLLHVRIAREEALKRGEPHLTVVELADTLRRLGYRVKLRTALGGGWGGACLRNLRHSFLAVTVEGPNGGTQLVVDPRFKEQFEIAHATPRYTQILEAVPTEAVVPQDRLNSAVEALCKELAAAFQASSIPLPPWRQAAAMMSKWQPRRSEEVEVMSGGERGQVDTAAVINNAVGVAPPRKAANNNNNNSKNIVAQKLAMLGIAPAPSSPISEGMEEADIAIDFWGSTDTTDNEGDDDHDHHFEHDYSNPLLSPSPDEVTRPLQNNNTHNQQQQWNDAAGGLMHVNAAHHHNNNRQPGTATAGGAPAVDHVWAGIKSAAAALPSRRSTWA